MAVSFKLNPRKGQKRPVSDAQSAAQGVPVGAIGEDPQPSAASSLPAAAAEPWYARPRQTLEEQLRALPDPPSEADYDAMPINVFAEAVLARVTPQAESNKKTRTA